MPASRALAAFIIGEARQPAAGAAANPSAFALGHRFTPFHHIYMPALASFVPVQAAIGGAFIGWASGSFMLLSGSIAGNSGALKAVVLARTQETAAIAFACGLVLSGALSGRLMPEHTFDMPEPNMLQFVGGVVVGVGTYLGNGCTSGHGLCGLSRLSFRSVVSVPTFMASAVCTSVLVNCDWKKPTSNTKLSFLWPPSNPTVEVLQLALTLALSLAGPWLILALFSWRSHGHAAMHAALKGAIGLWCGATFGVGLAYGGMVRPSTVSGALNVAGTIDLTLWVLFFCALCVTFVFYRIAQAIGVAQACVRPDALAQKVDRSLVLGAILFGVGWGATGFCPGPLLVSAAAAPSTISPLACLLGVVLGLHAADALKGSVPGQAATLSAPLKESLLPTVSKPNGELF